MKNVKRMKKKCDNANQAYDNIQDNNKKKFKKFKSIKNIIEYLIVFLIIFANAVLIIESVNNPNKTPNLFGKKAFVIISGSMIPEIQIGDIVLINNTNDVKINDIIAFRRDTTVIVHRIINEMKVSGNVMYQTKGDNNNVADTELVKVADIEGIMFGKIPYVGNFLMFLYNNLAIIVVVGIVILLLRNFLVSNE